MIGLGFNTAAKERLMQEYPEGCKVEFLADVQNVTAGEVGKVLSINDDLGIKIQILPDKLLTLYEFRDMVKVIS